MGGKRSRSTQCNDMGLETKQIGIWRPQHSSAVCSFQSVSPLIGAIGYHRGLVSDWQILPLAFICYQQISQKCRQDNWSYYKMGTQIVARKTIGGRQCVLIPLSFALPFPSEGSFDHRNWKETVCESQMVPQSASAIYKSCRFLHRPIRSPSTVNTFVTFYHINPMLVVKYCIPIASCWQLP